MAFNTSGDKYASQDRWDAKRKVWAIRCVQQGELTLDDLRELYAVSVEEYHSWIRNYSQGGLNALRVKATGQHKQPGGQCGDVSPARAADSGI